MLAAVTERWQVDSARGWAVVVAGAVGAGVSFGTVYTFGAFFDAMADDFGVGRGPTALVFGVTLLAFFGTGIVAAPLADRFGPRPLAVVGAVLLPLGLVLTSRVDDVAVGYLTYGIGVGVGGSLVISPLFTAASGWVVKRRPLALGCSPPATGLGTLVLVPFAEDLIDRPRVGATPTSSSPASTSSSSPPSAPSSSDRRYHRRRRRSPG